MNQDNPYIIYNVNNTMCIDTNQLYQIIKLYYQRITTHIPFLKNIFQCWFWKKAIFLQIGVALQKSTENRSIFTQLPEKLKKNIVEIGVIFLDCKPFHWKDFIFYQQYQTLQKYIKTLGFSIEAKKLENNRLGQIKTQLMLPSIFQDLKTGFSQGTGYKQLTEQHRLKFHKQEEQIQQIGNVSIQPQEFDEQNLPFTEKTKQIIKNNIQNQENQMVTFYLIGQNVLLLTKKGFISYIESKTQFHQYKQSPQVQIQIFWNRSKLQSSQNGLICRQKMILINMIRESLKKKKLISNIQDTWRYLYPLSERLRLQSPQVLIKNNVLSGISLYKLFQKALEEGDSSDTTWRQFLQIMLKLDFKNGKRDLFKPIAIQVLKDSRYLRKINISLVTLLDIYPTNKNLLITSHVVKLGAIPNILQQLFQKHKVQLKQFPLIIANKKLAIGVVFYNNSQIHYIYHTSKVTEKKNINEFLKQLSQDEQDIYLLLADTSASIKSKYRIQWFKKFIQIINRQNKKGIELKYTNKIDQVYQDIILYYSRAQKQQIYCQIIPSAFNRNDSCGPKTHYNSLPLEQRQKTLEFSFNRQKLKGQCFFNYFFWDQTKFVPFKRQINLYDQFQKIMHLIQPRLVWQMLIQSIWIDSCLSLLQNFQKRGYCPFKLGKYLHGDQFAAIQLSFTNEQSNGHRFLQNLFKNKDLADLLRIRKIVVYYSQKGKQIYHQTYLLDDKRYKDPKKQKILGLNLPGGQRVELVIAMYGSNAYQGKGIIDSIAKQHLGSWSQNNIFKQSRFKCKKYSFK